MSQPIDNTSSKKPGFLAQWAEMFGEGFIKANSECNEYCLEKCEKVWNKEKPQSCARDSRDIQDCSRECRKFQYLSPRYRD